MIQQYLKLITIWLRRVITQPRDELDRWQTAARFAYDLGRFGAKQLKHDRAPQMAAALAFRALFGLLPVLVVGTVLVGSFYSEDEFIDLIGGLLTAAKLDDIQVIGATADAAESQSLHDWLVGLIKEATQVNLLAIGWASILIVIYAAISLMVTIENAFNIVYRAPFGRSWTRRVPIYWFVLTVSSVVIGLAAYFNNQFETWIASIETGR